MFSTLRALLAEQFGPVAPWIEPQRRRVVEQAYAFTLLTDGVGLLVLPGSLRLRLLPHVVPQIMNWKRIAGDGWESHIKCGCWQGGTIVPTTFCTGWGQEIEIPAGITSGDIFDCPNWAGLSLRASEKAGLWSVTQVKKASCAVGEEMVVLPDDVQAGDIIKCHGIKQRVTYEFGAYALEKAE